MSESEHRVGSQAWAGGKGLRTVGATCCCGAAASVLSEHVQLHWLSDGVLHYLDVARDDHPLGASCVELIYMRALEAPRAPAAPRRRSGVPWVGCPLMPVYRTCPAPSAPAYKGL